MGWRSKRSHQIILQSDCFPSQKPFRVNLIWIILTYFFVFIAGLRKFLNNSSELCVQECKAEKISFLSHSHLLASYEYVSVDLINVTGLHGNIVNYFFVNRGQSTPPVPSSCKVSQSIQDMSIHFSS